MTNFSFAGNRANAPREPGRSSETKNRESNQSCKSNPAAEKGTGPGRPLTSRAVRCELR